MFCKHGNPRLNSHNLCQRLDITVYASNPRAVCAFVHACVFMCMCVCGGVETRGSWGFTGEPAYHSGGLQIHRESLKTMLESIRKRHLMTCSGLCMFYRNTHVHTHTHMCMHLTLIPQKKYTQLETKAVFPLFCIQ